jgi:uncharacterized membrane protein YfcA|tara:strand:+ start:623 stop:1372 length:750 start_codon:yes stop_codon:yes gene_type:complete
MVEINVIYYLLFFLIATLQTIAGVGILVLGTPLLLIFGYDIVSAISLLLPISILTSLTNLLIFKLHTKKVDINFDKNIKYHFFLFCIPSIFIGVFLLKIFQEIINFNILVSLIIFLTLAVKLYYQKNKLRYSNINKKLILSGIGLIHGLTNSGGTLLSIFILSLTKNLKKPTRYAVTFFYLFLASFQYLIFIIFFRVPFQTDLLIYLILIVSLGILFGNFIINYIQENTFKLLIEIIAFLSAIMLILNL